jgi:hypothetical protein
MYNFSHHWYLEGDWLPFVPWCMAVLVSTMFLLPFLLLKGRRLGFISVLCAAAILLLGAEAVRNWQSIEAIDLNEMVANPQSAWARQLRIIFARGGIRCTAIWYECGNDDGSPKTTQVSVELSAGRSLRNASLVPEELSFDWGFLAARWYSEPGSSGRRMLTLYVPVWTLPSILAITPACWFFTRKRRLRAYRCKHNACVNCGYSLQGHSAGMRCPECGTPITAKSRAPSTNLQSCWTTR